MKLNQQNKFVRFILRTIDLITAFYGHGIRRIRWDQDPYQKADLSQKRAAALFMALSPIFFLIFFGRRKSFDSWVDSMMYGRHSIIWFYLAFIGTVCFALVIGYKVAPKIPLFVSIPMAIMAWVIFISCGWTHSF